MVRASAMGLAVLVAGCTSPAGKPDLANRKPRVVATTGMVADAARIVGGDRVEVEALMGPGVDPHGYIAEAGDIDKFQQADLVLFNGLDLEGKMEDVLDALAKRGKAVAVTDRLDRGKDLRTAEAGFEGTHDPHVWFDVTLWSKVVERVADALADLDPNHAAGYRERLAAYLAELKALDAEVRSRIARLPREKRVLITAHDAFHYFGRAYGFDVKGLQGVSTASGTSTRDRQELVELIGTKKIRAIFAETSVNPKGLRGVQEDVKSRYDFDVKLADAKLYSDALGEPGSGAESYLGMVRHNVGAIVAALSE